MLCRQCETVEEGKCLPDDVVGWQVHGGRPGVRENGLPHSGADHLYLARVLAVINRIPRRTCDLSDGRGRSHRSNPEIERILIRRQHPHLFETGGNSRQVVGIPEDSQAGTVSTGRHDRVRPDFGKLTEIEQDDGFRRKITRFPDPNQRFLEHSCRPLVIAILNQRPG